MIDKETANELSITDKENWRDYTLNNLFVVSKFVGLYFPEFGEYKKEDFENYLDNDFKTIEEVIFYFILGHTILKEEIELCLITD